MQGHIELYRDAGSTEHKIMHWDKYHHHHHKNYAVSSRFQNIGTFFVHFTNMRFLYVCLIICNVLTNVLLPLVLFILRQGSVLLQHVPFTDRWPNTRFSSQKSSVHSHFNVAQIKNCVSHLWLDFFVVLWPQASAVPYCLPSGYTSLDAGRLPAIYIPRHL